MQTNLLTIGRELWKDLEDEKGTESGAGEIPREKCYDSFKSVLGDFSIGRTYNIFPSGSNVYRTDSKARITLNIPAALQADTRTFKMLCVTEQGLPVELLDIDSDPKTITFETDTYYAFALVYK